MNDLLANLHHLEVVIVAAGVIGALLLDSSLGPAEDDLPLRFKVILVVPVIAAVFQVQRLTNEQRGLVLPYVFGLFLLVLLGYSVIWALLGYTKEVATPQSWWKFWSNAYAYKKVRVMGGCLLPQARDTIRSESITAQEYFEGTAYSQDRVWTR